MLIIPGFIISGGLPTNNLNNFELYNPTSGNSCPPQDLQIMRYRHSSCSNLICGGIFDKLHCEKIDGNEVSLLPLTLRQERSDHLCWSLPEQKILLLGGAGSPSTTEIVSGLSSSDSFELEYRIQ